MSGNILDVVIVGAGISGLTCGFELADDMDILILEKEHVAGGRIHGEKWKNYHYAAGAEYTGEVEDDFAELVQELKLKPLPVPTPTDAVFVNKKIYVGDAQYNFFSDKAKKDFIKLQKELKKFSGEIEYPEVHYSDEKYLELDKISLEEYFTEKEIDKSLIDFINIHTKGIFGRSNKDISALFGLLEVAYNFEEEEIEFDKTDTDYNEEEGQYESDVYTFKSGMKEVTDALYEDLKELIFLKSEVKEIKKVEGYYEISFYDSTRDQLMSVKTHQVVLSTQAPITLKIADSIIPDEIISLLESIKYSAYLTVHLFTEHPIWNRAWDLACFDMFFTDLYDATRVQNFHEKIPDEERKGIISAYIPLLENKFVNADDYWIREETLKDMEKIFPEIRKELITYSIYRFPYAFPIPSPGYASITNSLRKYNKQDPSITLTGDYTLYPTLEGAVTAGYLASEEVLKKFRKKKRNQKKRAKQNKKKK